jgi:hypothetical protein
MGDILEIPPEHLILGISDDVAITLIDLDIFTSM